MEHVSRFDSYAVYCTIIVLVFAKQFEQIATSCCRYFLFVLIIVYYHYYHYLLSYIWKEYSGLCDHLYAREGVKNSGSKSKFSVWNCSWNSKLSSIYLTKWSFCVADFKILFLLSDNSLLIIILKLTDIFFFFFFFFNIASPLLEHGKFIHS